ncbi:hypothetical protein M9H77_04298 [Catharanthus roseus]|uniref:Uncharacterized protein n=1 Tax=Catharanthus roseus TaxID=4058 RepID=A0ACC0CDV2_CATRO|nr:hypothetical protein M9H77_04298 [Catharanthus roseus]
MTHDSLMAPDELIKRIVNIPNQGKDYQNNYEDRGYKLSSKVQLGRSSQAPVVISGAQIMPSAHSSKGQHCTTLGNITDAAHKRSKELEESWGVNGME